MGRGSHLLTLVLAAAAASGCSSGADDPGAGGAAGPGPVVTEGGSYDGPASLANPLGTGVLGVDRAALRTALIDAIGTAGGVRATVTGGPYDTVVEVDPTADPDLPDGRRFSWRQDGVDREQLHLADERVCVNRASAEPIRRTLSGALHGTVVFSERPYSCTGPNQVNAFLTRGLHDLDPVERLGWIDEWTGLEDLGTETGPDGATTRHLHLDGAHASTTEAPVPWDLWLDEELHVTRMEYGALAAELEYGPVPAVELPPAGDRGPIRLVFFPVGSGRPPVTAPSG